MSVKKKSASKCLISKGPTIYLSKLAPEGIKPEILRGTHSKISSQSLGQPQMGLSYMNVNLVYWANYSIRNKLEVILISQHVKWHIIKLYDQCDFFLLGDQNKL